MIVRRDFLRYTALAAGTALGTAAMASSPAAALGSVAAHTPPNARPRIIWNTDIGGSDPDDWQSLVHLLVYADRFDIEGLVHSPPGTNSAQPILDVIDVYERDYANLRTYSPRYPKPDRLRAITKQGAAGYGWQRPAGFDRPTEGSQWIVERARRHDRRPLYLLMAGGIDDLAQALHDAPDILPKLRVYWIGGPNKMWSVEAYDYIETHHPKLWMIESNSTYRGWFTGGDQTGEWGNTAFVTTHVAGKGALGDFFAGERGGELKMGDSPAIGWFLNGVQNPSKPSWGGRYARLWDGRRTVFDRLTTSADTVETYGVTEIALPIPDGFTSGNTAQLLTDGRVPSLAVNDGKALRFRFSPKTPQVWSYVIQSDFAGLDGLSGQFTAVAPPIERASRPSATHPNWWCDDQDPAAAVGIYPGAKSVSQWRLEYLRDFADRMLRCAAPARPPRVRSGA
ncbi:DUF1593 domain-containing protein [Actinoallomurus iriomotensis]|uniref:Cellulose-binding Sde182 nucleoside hydrolase-like domain-containing protein n=1 Tax=Actinoallomurus iriomotensis TaxID=478107 RepID=A0A9W6S5P5_9ACTN|nr:DUF1593 domain-containing protein [Actinoallomurus iriomotensis]GLY88815.1 hypothetical protein Airi02_067440 [Actinoallomurus iriomotensis]